MKIGLKRAKELRFIKDWLREGYGIALRDLNALLKWAMEAESACERFIGARTLRARRAVGL